MNAWLAIGAANGFLAVAAGALAAHGVHGCIDGCIDMHALSVIETGARYQMYHALAIGLAALAMREAGASAAQAAAALFLTGIVLFSGSLYLLALTGVKTLGIVTPFGGLAFLLGWAALFWSAMKRA